MNTKVVGRRVVAFIIDAIIVTAINLAIFFALAGDPVEGLTSGDLAPTDTVYGNLELGDKTYSVYGGTAALYFALTLAVTIGYWVVLQGLKGLTVGKAMMGIRVVKDDGMSPPGIGRAFGRWFLYIADAFPYFLPNLTGFIVAMVSKKNQRLGDMVASTLVVDKNSVGAGPLPGGDAGPSWVEGTRAPEGTAPASGTPATGTQPPATGTQPPAGGQPPAGLP